jgi:hypothetical protein
MTNLLQGLLALMVQPLREFLEDDDNLSGVSLEDAVKLRLELHKASAQLEDEVRRKQREHWETTQ